MNRDQQDVYILLFKLVITVVRLSLGGYIIIRALEKLLEEVGKR